MEIYANILFLRMLAFSLAVVDDEDIVVTADVDAFIASNLILKPLTVVGCFHLLSSHS